VVALAILTPGAAHAQTLQLRPLLLTTSQAIKATGFTGTLTPGTPLETRCGRQPQTKAPYCSHVWESIGAKAHPTISTVASFASAVAARAFIQGEAGRAERAGTIVEKSATRLVYFVTGLPDIGTAAVAQQSTGSTYTYAWCTSAASEPTAPAVQCAKDLLAAQTKKAISG
jgi:hypothetical protein